MAHSMLRILDSLVPPGIDIGTTAMAYSKLMASVKTAISMDAELIGRLDAAARELGVPRSRLLAQAASAFLERRDNARLLELLNAAHAEPPTAEEAAVRSAQRAVHRRSLRQGPVQE